MIWSSAWKSRSILRRKRPSSLSSAWFDIRR
jgi:hypothetical protein